MLAVLGLLTAWWGVLLAGELTDDGMRVRCTEPTPAGELPALVATIACCSPFW